MEGGGGESQPPLHRLHHIPRISPWVPFGSRYRYRHPRCQTTPLDIPLPAQVVQRLGKVQVPVDTGGIWSGAQGPPTSPQVLGETPYGGAGRLVLQRTPPQRDRYDAGRTTGVHHIKCGGGRIVPPLVIIDGGKIWGGAAATTTRHSRWAVRLCKATMEYVGRKKDLRR